MSGLSKTGDTPLNIVAVVLLALTTLVASLAIPLAMPLIIPSAISSAYATEISVDYSYPLIYEEDDNIITDLEGSITADIEADGPIELLEPDPTVIRLNSQHYRYVFHWSEDEAKAVSFLDEHGDTLTVSLFPEPRMPLDLLAHDATVLSIEIAPGSLWEPDTGIYCWGYHDNLLQTGDEWERTAQLICYDSDGTQAFSEAIGLRINGQSGRADPQHGLRFYFDDYGAAQEVDHDFFGGEPTIFQRLVLRNLRYPDFALSSSIAEPLHMELGHLGSRLDMIGCYLNGEYWGAYMLRERLDSKFIEDTHELASDDYIFLKDRDEIHGEYAAWNDFLTNFTPPRDYSDHAWYQDIALHFDLLSYIDWLFINIFGASADNGHTNNLALLKVGDGPWRYLMWDEDILFQSPNLDSNHFRFYACSGEAEFYEFMPDMWFMGGWLPTYQRWFDMFRGLMQNSEFKALFSRRCDDLLAGPLSVDALQARVDSVVAAHGQEVARYSLRWGWYASRYTNKANAFKSFIGLRHAIVVQQKADFMAHFRVPVELSQFSASRDPAGALLRWRTEAESDNEGFIILRGEGSPENMVEIASYLDHPELEGQIESEVATEYSFVDGTAPAGVELFYQLQHVPVVGEPVLHNWIETVTVIDVSQLVVNEFLTLNDSVNQDEAGEFDDWVEIYNPGDEAVALDGLYLTDDLAEPLKWAFPDTSIAAGAFMLVWCDDDPEQGPLHATFKLSGDGEQIGFYDGVAEPPAVVDTLSYGPQSVDVSQGREYDGADNWIFFTSPTPEASNGPATAVPPGLATRLMLYPPHPNPATARATVSLRVPGPQDLAIDLAVFDLRGRRVRQLAATILPPGEHSFSWDRRDGRGRPAAAGTYLLRLIAGKDQLTRKIVIVR